MKKLTCTVEIAEGISFNVQFHRNLDDKPEIDKTFIINKDNIGVEVVLPDEAMDTIIDLVIDELSSLSFEDSTVKELVF